MTDNVAVTAGSGTTIAADEVSDGTLGSCKVQYVKIMDGTLDGTTKAAVGANGLAVAVASGGIASGAVASGAVASGAFASGSIASGAIASGAIATGAIAAGAASIADNEDAVSADGDRGVKVLAVRKATPANTSGSDGDYEFLQLSAGRVWTNTLLGDGTNAVAVKAASTPAAATDPGLVVSLSPNGLNSNGRTTPAASAPVVLNSQAYEKVAPSQTEQVLGGSGALGDYLDGLLIIPQTTSPGAVLLVDSTTTATVFVGGASSVSNLVPFLVPFGAISQVGAWKVTTGSNVNVIGIGNFT